MRKIVCCLLLICIVSSPPIYARSKVKVHEKVRVRAGEIAPPLPPYDESEYYELNEVEITPPLPYKSQMDCCSRRNKKNTIENQQAYIAIATVVLLGIATLGMIFVARDSH